MEFSRRSVLLGSLVLAGPAAALPLFYSVFPETAAGWAKNSSNPVLGKPFGTCFDAAVLHEGPIYRMWFSWRPEKSIAYCESADGTRWTDPTVVLPPIEEEQDVNRPTILRRDGLLQMWFTSQTVTKSWINFATSPDGKNWSRISSPAAMIADRPWEKVAVMCPEVHWDSDVGLYRMWYSGGEQFEPDAIGYATSTDGVHWTKLPDPIFKADKSLEWESAKVTACSVRRLGQWYYMFYIGFKDEHTAAIGIAKSRNGISSWLRNRDNPIIRHGAVLAWDGAAVYKPVPVIEPDRWLLWYNARRRSTEQIGLASHAGLDLGF
jgi:hypothetical protein